MSNPRKNHKYIRREYVNGQWRYFYEDKKSIDDKKSVTSTKTNTSKNRGLEVAKKIDRYVETAKAWLNSRLSMTIVGTITGKEKPMSWNEAEKWVEKQYRSNGR